MPGPKPNLERRIELLKICFDTFCESGLENTGMKKLADACGITNGALIYYFGSKDNLVIESTAYCMAKVEDDLWQMHLRVLKILNAFCVRCLI